MDETKITNEGVDLEGEIREVEDLRDVDDTEAGGEDEN